MTKLQAEIIIALADNGMNVSCAAKKIYMSRGTVNYHIRRIKQKTGKNPRDYYDMRDLLSMAQRVLSDETTFSERTLQALNEMGRKTHGAEI